MNKRLFIGFRVSRKIIDIISMLRSTLIDQEKYYNWVSGNNLHLTLLYLGSQEANQIDEITKRIYRVSNEFNDFTIELCLGLFKTQAVNLFGLIFLASATSLAFLAASAAAFASSAAAAFFASRVAASSAFLASSAYSAFSANSSSHVTLVFPVINFST